MVDSNVVVKELTPDRICDWDAFVEQCGQATFFHRAGWKEVIERTFGHRTCFLYAEKEGRIVGVLPLAQVRSYLFGNALISMPFCVYGGVAAVTDDAYAPLITEAQALARRLKVDYLELRNRTPSAQGWPTKDLYVTFRKEIDPEPEKNLAEIPRKQRAMVRKGMKLGLASAIDGGIDRFFNAYAESVRNLGTPVYPRRYFSILQQVFGHDCEILTVTHEGNTVSSVMSFYFRDEVLPYYGGGTAVARDLYANDFMYWELMRRSAEKGIRVFDYGRSKIGTGSYHFKKNWGFTPEPLYYQYHLVRAEAMPDINPLNPKYRTFIHLWKRLPLPLAKVIGPVLAKNLG